MISKQVQQKTELYKHKKCLEAGIEELDYLCSEKKALIICAVTAQLICASVFRICEMLVTSISCRVKINNYADGHQQMVIIDNG